MYFMKLEQIPQNGVLWRIFAQMGNWSLRENLFEKTSKSEIDKEKIPMKSQFESRNVEVLSELGRRTQFDVEFEKL